MNDERLICLMAAILFASDPEAWGATDAAEVAVAIHEQVRIVRERRAAERLEATHV